jgi:hypothetical protein
MIPSSSSSTASVAKPAPLGGAGAPRPIASVAIEAPSIVATFRLERSRITDPVTSAVAREIGSKYLESACELSSTDCKKHTLELSLPGAPSQKIEIRDFKDVECAIKTIQEYVTTTSLAAKVYLRTANYYEERSHITELKKLYQAHIPLDAFEFRTSSSFDPVIFIQPRPISKDILSDGKTRQTFSNGIIEESISLNSDSFKGIRISPNGQKEVGIFDFMTRILKSGYRINEDKTVQFVNPGSLATFKNEEEKITFNISEFEDELIVLEERFSIDTGFRYEISTIPVDVILDKFIRSKTWNSKSIKPILLHPSFNQYQKNFIEYIFSKDELGTPRIFNVSISSAIDLIEVGSKIIDINPLTIVDDATGKNLFIQAVSYDRISKSGALLDKLCQFYPEQFVTVGRDILQELLLQNYDDCYVKKIAEKFESLGGALDVFLNLWIQVAQCTKLDESFREQFSTLSIEEKQTLYRAAFDYNNSSLYEPCETPIANDQYSINLMWINKTRMSEDQEFLFGKGSTSEEKGLDFHETFILPVSAWAKANPGSSINIWIDSEMATAHAVERSKAALNAALEGTSHGTIQFRDVREMGIVRENPRAFTEEIPVYFRVDLLRAIAADYTLTRKETKFFVYGDIDMEPLSRDELFDKRTVDFLDDLGFVMAKGGFLGFENGFQILNGEHPLLMDAHRKVIIDLSIDMAIEIPKHLNEQQIYDTYPAMVTHLLDADGRYGKINSKRCWVMGDSKMFRYDRFGNSAHHVLPIGETKIELKSIMPTKPVRLPRSHFG